MGIRTSYALLAAMILINLGTSAVVGILSRDFIKSLTVFLGLTAVDLILQRETRD